MELNIPTYFRAFFVELGAAFVKALTIPILNAHKQLSNRLLSEKSHTINYDTPFHPTTTI